MEYTALKSKRSEPARQNVQVMEFAAEASFFTMGQQASAYILAIRSLSRTPSITKPVAVLVSILVLLTMLLYEVRELCYRRLLSDQLERFHYYSNNIWFLEVLVLFFCLSFCKKQYQQVALTINQLASLQVRQ